MTKLNQLKPLCLAAVPALLATTAHALYETDAGVVYVNASASATWDSNVFTNSDEVDDLLFRLIPSLNYIQDRGLVHMMASASTAFNEYDDLDAQSGNDYFIDVQFTGMHRSPNPDGNFSFGASYADQDIASREIATRIDVTDFNLNGSGTFDFSEKTGIRLSGDWGTRDYKESGFQDSDDLGARADLLYTYSEKLKGKIGYRYREISYDDGIRDNESDTFIIGAEGVFSEKVTGSAEIGASSGNLYDGTRLYYSLGLDWKADQNTSWSLSGKRDSTPSAIGADATNTRLDVSVAQRFTNLVSGTANVGVGQFERDGSSPRDDDVLYLGAGISTSVLKNGSVFATVDYEDRNSNSPVSDYDRLLVTLGISQQF